ncbi:MAG: hypothetical protein JWP12_1947 [Bacteroidetes bacterium]|nr:hypothetical protein [Bacteroidota bacterium]
MKKIIIAVALVVATTVASFAGPVVSVHFEIGRKSLGCTNFGICKAGVDVDWKLSTIQINDATNTLQIVMLKDLIVGKEQYFKGNTITFEEAFTFSADVQKALGSKNRITIEAGTYELVKIRGGYQINISLK